MPASYRSDQGSTPAEDPTHARQNEANRMEVPSAQLLEMRGTWILAFVPVLCFLLCCVTFFVYLKAFDLVGLAAGGFLSLMIGALFAKNYASFWDAVMRGIASTTSVTIVVILFVIGMFSEMIKAADLSSGFVWMADALGIGGGVIAVFVFVTVSLVAASTGSSIGSMFTAFAIFYPAGAALGAEPALVAGAIISGALFGDSIAPISDNTIISASTQKFRSKPGVADVAGVVKSRLRYALLAAAMTAVLLVIMGIASGDAEGGGFGNPPSPKTLIMLIPVVLLMVTAFLTRDIFKAATVGLFSGTFVAIVSGILTPSDVVGVQDGALTGFVTSGVGEIMGTVALVISVFGIMGVLNAAGVLDRVVERLLQGRWVHTPRGAEASIGLGISATTVLFGGVNSAAMMTFGPVADEIGSRVGLHPYRRSNVLECFAMGLSCIVPFLSAFLFIGSQLTQGHEGVPALSTLDLFPATLYPLALTVVMAVAIFTGWGRTFEGPDGVQLRQPHPSTELPADVKAGA